MEKWMLKTKRDSGFDTYILVDENNKPILKKQEWSTRPQEVIKIVKSKKK